MKPTPLLRLETALSLTAQSFQTGDKDGLKSELGCDVTIRLDKNGTAMLIDVRPRLKRTRDTCVYLDEAALMTLLDTLRTHRDRREQAQTGTAHQVSARSS